MSDILPGPLVLLSRAIECRLKDVLPTRQFTHQWLPAKMDKGVWDQMVRRCPAVSYEYVGLHDVQGSAYLIGTGVWNVWLATKNASSAEAGLFGDALTPQGSLAVQQVAMAALHGRVVPGAGTITVAKAEPVGFLDRDDPGVTMVCVTLHAVRLDISLSSVLAADIINAGTLLTEGVKWGFGPADAIVQTDTDTYNTTGTV